MNRIDQTIFSQDIFSNDLEFFRFRISTNSSTEEAQQCGSSKSGIPLELRSDIKRYLSACLTFPLATDAKIPPTQNTAKIMKAVFTLLTKAQYCGGVI